MMARLLAAAPFMALSVAALVLLVLAHGFDAAAAAGRIGPGAWPGMVAGLLALVAAGKALALVRGGDERDGPDAIDEQVAAPLQPWRAIVALALFAGYCLTLEMLGFPLATALLLGGFLLVAGYHRPLPLLATACGGSIGLFLVFRSVVYVSLPLGKGPFLALSLGLLQLLGAA